MTVQTVFKGGWRLRATRPFGTNLNWNENMTHRSERGASSVEYALLVALIAAVICSTVLALGLTNGASWQDSCDKITTAFGAGC